MNKEELVHLGELARIRLDDRELSALEQELSAIVDYVGQVNAVVSTADTTAPSEPTVGALYNVLRPDVVTNEPGEYTETLLREMPRTDGQFMKVPKIIDTNKDS
jgi:aspartyl-tRNA(Asn)/glutamyl-tRNA(Gln) amidotransferase subunit C